MKLQLKIKQNRPDSKSVLNFVRGHKEINCKLGPTYLSYKFVCSQLAVISDPIKIMPVEPLINAETSIKCHLDPTYV